LYWFSGGPDFGARYWYLMIIPLVVLTVRGISFLEGIFKSRLPGSSITNTHIFVAVLSLSVLALVNYLPWRALDKYYHYLGMQPDILNIAKEYNFGKSLVMILGKQHPDFESAWIYNPLDPYADEPIYAWDKNEQVLKQVLQAYSDRPVWFVEGPTITHQGYKVIAGPLSANKLLIGGGTPP